MPSKAVRVHWLLTMWTLYMWNFCDATLLCCTLGILKSLMLLEVNSQLKLIKSKHVAQGIVGSSTSYLMHLLLHGFPP